MKLLSFVFCAFLVAQVANAQKLNIEVLYESLCPDSVRFIKNQLTPNYNEIADYVNITFVPFGKSYSDEGHNFQCQHGPTECKGNRIQSCVLQALPEQANQVQYVDCFMRSFYDNPVELGQKCATQAGVHWEVVKQCVESDAGTLLQLQAEKVTMTYTPTFIPTIVYNKHFDAEAQELSVRGLRDYICERLQKTQPDACAVIRFK